MTGSVKQPRTQSSPRVAPAGGQPRHVMLVVNSCWNVINFRMGLVRGMLAHGYAVTVAAPRDEFSSAVERLGCDFIELRMHPHGRSPLQEMLLLFRLAGLIRRRRPDCLLAYTPKPNVYASLAAALWRVPVINNVPGLGLVFNESGPTARILRLLYRIALRRSSRVFFQNSSDMALFLDAGLVRRSAVDLLPGSGVDLARFVGLPEQDGAFAFLLIARLLWEKGVAEYVEAGRAVRALHPNVQVRILGFIDDRSAAAIPRAQIEAWRADGAIEYLGSADDVRPHIAAAHCIVLPSYYREGTPRTLLEAAAMAKPIITSDMPGCCDVVTDGLNGFLVPPRDPTTLAERMIEMIEMPSERLRTMGAASRAKVEREYDEQIVVRKYLDAIETGIAAAKPTGTFAR